MLAGSGIEYAENPDDALYVAFTHGTHSVLNDAPEPKIAAMWTHSLHHRFTLVALTKIEDRRRAAEASGNTTWADDPQTAQLLRAVQALTAPPSNGYVYRLVLRPERVHVKDVVPRRYLHRALDDVYYRRGTRVLSRDFGEACFLELDERGFVVVRTADGSEPDPLQVQTLRAAIIDDDENYYQLPRPPLHRQELRGRCARRRRGRVRLHRRLRQHDV